MTRIDQDTIADPAMRALERQGIPIVRSDMPGLYVGPTAPELTYNQLIAMACAHDRAFDPARVSS